MPTLSQFCPLPLFYQVTVSGQVYTQCSLLLLLVLVNLPSYMYYYYKTFLLVLVVTNYLSQSLYI